MYISIYNFLLVNIIIYASMIGKPSFREILIFYINMFQLALFIIGIHLLYLGVGNITLESLPIISSIRYLILSRGVLIAGVIYLTLKWLSPEKLETLYKIVAYPYMLEQVRDLIRTTRIHLFLNTFANKVIYIVYESISMKYVLFTIHIGLFYVLRCIWVIFFVNFTFFMGDLRYCLYLTPFMFMRWILSFISYWMECYIRESLEMGTSFIIVNTNMNLTDDRHHTINSKDVFTFELTDYALELGFIPEKTLEYFAHRWYALVNYSSLYNAYKEKGVLLNKILLAITIICWFSISIQIWLNLVSF